MGCVVNVRGKLDVVLDKGEEVRAGVVGALNAVLKDAVDKGEEVMGCVVNWIGTLNAVLKVPVDKEKEVRGCVVNGTTVNELVLLLELIIKSSFASCIPSFAENISPPFTSMNCVVWLTEEQLPGQRSK